MKLIVSFIALIAAISRFLAHQNDQVYRRLSTKWQITTKFRSKHPRLKGTRTS